MLARLKEVAEDIAHDRDISLEEAVTILREGVVSSMKPPIAAPEPRS